MHVVITDVTTAQCDMTGRNDVECLRVRLDESAAEITCIPTELIKLLRLRKKQERASSQPDKKGGPS